MQVADRNRELRVTVVLALVCAVLQLALAPHLALGNGRINFALVFAAVCALRIGGRAGVLLGFFSGLFFDLSTTGPIGLMAFCLSVVGFLLGREGRERMQGEPTAMIGAFASASVAVSLVYHLAMLLVGQADSLLDALVFRTLPTAVLTLVAFLPFAWVLTHARPSSSSLGRPGAGHLARRRL